MERKQAWSEIAIAYALIEAALWTEHWTQLAWTVVATIGIVFFVLRRKPSPHDLGLTVPSLRATGWTLLAAAILASLVLLGGLLAGTWNPRHPTWPPLQNPEFYAVWSFLQEFMLQSFFYVRVESGLQNSRLAVLITALLFSAAHIPSPVLTMATLLGGLFFCEFFRRYRNIYLLGTAHALLGFALAESLSVILLRHMRVGIGYLHTH